MCLHVVKHEKARRGFVSLPRCQVIEQSFAWASRFRRLARDDERLPTTLAGLHLVAIVFPILKHFAVIPKVHNTLKAT